MWHVTRPRLGVCRKALLGRSKRIDVYCVKAGRRRLSATAAEPSKPAAGSSSSSASADEPGWPLKYKLAGGAFLGTLIPWMFSYAMSNDPGSRRLVGKLSPGLVQWFRSREKDGHFFDEDPKRVEYLARAPEWIDQPVTMEVRTSSGETRRLQGLDARTPFSSVGGLVYADGRDGGGGGRAGTGGHAPTWLTDFDVLDEGDNGDGAGGRTQTPSSSWDTTSSGAGAGAYQSVNGAAQRDVAACNIRSWWDIAALEEERARQPAALPAAAAAAGTGAGTSSSVATRPGSVSVAGGVKKMSSAEQAQAMIEHLDRLVESLEQDKLTGARSVDDVEEEVRDLRKQQRELRRKHPGRRRFLGLF